MLSNHSDEMRDRLAEPGEFIILHIGGNSTNKQKSGSTIRTKDSQYWFFEVADTALLDREPIKLYDREGNARGPVDSGSGLDFGRLFDSSGDDILRNDDDDWQVYHFSLGVKQPKVRVYPRIPENQNGGGFEYLSGSQPDPTAGSPFGYKRAENLGYEEPDSSFELFAWREGVRSEHQFGFYNDSRAAVDPIVKVKGLSYNLRPVDDQSQMLQLLADNGKPEHEQENKVHTVNWSPVTNEAFSYEVPEEWKDSQNTITVTEANLPSQYEASTNSSSSGGNR